MDKEEIAQARAAAILARGRAVQAQRKAALEIAQPEVDVHRVVGELIEAITALIGDLYDVGERIDEAARVPVGGDGE